MLEIDSIPVLENSCWRLLHPVCLSSPSTAWQHKSCPGLLALYKTKALQCLKALPEAFLPPPPRLGGCRLYPSRLILTLAFLQPAHPSQLCGHLSTGVFPEHPTNHSLAGKMLSCPKRMAKQLEAGMEQEPSVWRGVTPPHAPLGSHRNSLLGQGTGVGDRDQAWLPCLQPEEEKWCSTSSA